jgi:23S rRNA (uracil1939-C5)-methyltransferase
MSLSPDAIVELVPEKPVVGGRMLARVDGVVVLVSGAIPGERVTARIERRQQGVWFADTVAVLEASPDRRDPGPDRACGGMTFAHIRYVRQCALKCAMVQDAIARIAKVRLGADIPMTTSEPTGYRSRYRVHEGHGRLGFYREGSHDVCDPASSGQLADASLSALSDLAAVLPADAGALVGAFEIIENLPNTERALNLAMRADDAPPGRLVEALAGLSGFAGLSMTGPRPTRTVTLAGRPWVSDPVAALASPGQGAAVDASVRRHAAAFFQANRFVTPTLAARVAGLALDGSAVDLYAGVGLFAVTLAAVGGGPLVAVESDPISGADLEVNAAPFASRLTVRRETVERFLRSAADLHATTLIVDPPRTGMSRLAMEAILAARARRIVYVSCDVATLARDLRRFLDAGYSLTHLEALDLFPNTAHVEALAVVDRAS